MKRVVKVNTAGADESALKGVVYPNPAQDLINIDFEASEIFAIGSNGTVWNLVALDRDGRRWSVVDLPNGFYTLKVQSRNRVMLHKKMVVMH
jgi:hypothetical protein